MTRANAAEARQQFRSGQEALRDGRVVEAQSFFANAILSDPGLAAAHCALGQTRLALKEYGAAVESLTVCKALTREPGGRGLVAVVATEQARDDELRELRDSLRRLESGQVSTASNNTEMTRIQARIRDLESQKMKGLQAARMPAEIPFALGTALLRTGALESAERELREAIQQRPGYGQAHNNLAAVYVGLGRWDEAKAQLSLTRKAGFQPSPQLERDVAERHSSQPVEPRVTQTPLVQPDEDRQLWIDHQAADCVLADAFPVIEARFLGAEVARARVWFRGKGDDEWSATPMFPRHDGSYSAVLPKPKASLGRLHYILEATQSRARTTSSQEYEASVVASADACPQGRLAALAVNPPLIPVEVPQGGRLPADFSGKNVVQAQASGRVVKGRPTTALLAAAGAGAVAGALTLLKDAPTAGGVPTLIDAYVRLTGSNPRQGSAISLRQGSLSLTFDVFLPQPLPAGGEVAVQLHQGSPDATPACVTLVASYAGEFKSFSPRQVSVSSPFAVDPSCGPSFHVTQARVVFRAFGSVYFRTGPQGALAPGLLDPQVDYRFEP